MKKKLGTFLALFLAFGLVFSACSKDKPADKVPATLVGDEPLGEDVFNELDQDIFDIDEKLKDYSDLDIEIASNDGIVDFVDAAIEEIGEGAGNVASITENEVTLATEEIQETAEEVSEVVAEVQVKVQEVAKVEIKENVEEAIDEEVAEETASLAGETASQV